VAIQEYLLPAQWQYVLPGKRYADLILQSDAELPAVEKSVYDAIVDSHVLAATQQPKIVPADLCLLLYVAVISPLQQVDDAKALFDSLLPHCC
jgi:hypothetical protein